MSRWRSRALLRPASASERERVLGVCLKDAHVVLIERVVQTYDLDIRATKNVETYAALSSLAAAWTTHWPRVRTKRTARTRPTKINRTFLQG